MLCSHRELLVYNPLPSTVLLPHHYITAFLFLIGLAWVGSLIFGNLDFVVHALSPGVLPDSLLRWWLRQLRPSAEHPGEEEPVPEELGFFIPEGLFAFSHIVLDSFGKFCSIIIPKTLRSFAGSRKRWRMPISVVGIARRVGKCGLLRPFSATYVDKHGNSAWVSLVRTGTSRKRLMVSHQDGKSNIHISAPRAPDHRIDRDPERRSKTNTGLPKTIILMLHQTQDTILGWPRMHGMVNFNSKMGKERGRASRSFLCKWRHHLHHRHPF